MTPSPLSSFVSWLAILLAAAAIFLGALSAGAQEVPTPDYLLLARSCVSERGWRTETDDCAAVAEVVRARMERRGVSFREAIRALAPRLHGGTITRRLWLLDLDEDAHRPARLAAPWERPIGAGPSRRDAWLATLDEARRILAGEVPSPCLERPHAWGSAQDLERRRAAGYRWRDANCPGATFVNRFGFLSRRVERSLALEVDPE